MDRNNISKEFIIDLDGIDFAKDVLKKEKKALYVILPVMTVFVWLIAFLRSRKPGTEFIWVVTFVLYIPIVYIIITKIIKEREIIKSIISNIQLIGDGVQFSCVDLPGVEEKTYFANRKTITLIEGFNGKDTIFGATVTTIVIMEKDYKKVLYLFDGYWKDYSEIKMEITDKKVIS